MRVKRIPTWLAGILPMSVNKEAQLVGVPLTQYRALRRLTAVYAAEHAGRILSCQAVMPSTMKNRSGNPSGNS